MDYFSWSRADTSLEEGPSVGGCIGSNSASANPPAPGCYSWLVACSSARFNLCNVNNKRLLTPGGVWLSVLRLRFVLVVFGLLQALTGSLSLELLGRCSVVAGSEMEDTL